MISDNAAIPEIDDPLIKIDYRNMADVDVVREIVQLGEACYEGSMSEYCRLATYFIEDCKVAKKQETLELLLDEVVKITTNHSRMVSLLRMTFSVRKSLNNWHSTRDKVVVILEKEDPERAKRLLSGLDELAPAALEEMDGLDAWQSLVKQAGNYA